MIAILLAALAQSGVESSDPTNLAQFQSNGTTVIPVGGTALSTTVVLSGTCNGSPDPTPPRHALQVEIRPVTDALTGTVTHQGAGLVAPGGTSVVTVTGLTPGVSYHWQARTWKT
jgi:hypothetical protein